MTMTKRNKRWKKKRRRRRMKRKRRIGWEVFCAIFPGPLPYMIRHGTGKLGTLVADNWHITVRIQTYWTLHLYVNPNTGDIIDSTRPG
jgi:hypothetical protein